MKQGMRNRIIGRVHEALKRGATNADVTLNLVLLSEGDPERWMPVLMAHLTRTPIPKEPAPKVNDPYDQRGGR